MKHFTHTGFYAGRPFCGQAKNEHDEYAHPPYNAEAEAAMIAHPDFCPRCLAAMQAAALLDEAEDHLRNLSFLEMSGGFTEAQIETILDTWPPERLKWALAASFDDILAALE